MKEHDNKWFTRRGAMVLLAIIVLVGVLAGPCEGQEQSTNVKRIGPSSSEETTPTVPKETNRPELQRRNAEYQLARGDIFDLNFPFQPEFNQTVTIQSDGYVALMGLGERYVAGKTVTELTQMLQKAYAVILRDPTINVVPKDFDKPYFIAGGQIGRPGKYDLRGDTTLAEAIAIAGGFTGQSKHSQVLLFRRVSNDWAEARIIDVKKMFAEGNLKEDLHLQPGDMIFVPQNKISKIKPWIPYPSLTTGFYPPL